MWFSRNEDTTASSDSVSNSPVENEFNRQTYYLPKSFDPASANGKTITCSSKFVSD